MEQGRVKTGINGFDDLIEGGFPKNSNILVSGQPGTGKTIMGLQFLRQGAIEGQNGMYVSFEQDNEDIILQGSKFGWNLEKFIDEGKLILSSLDVKEFRIDNLVQEIKIKKIERLVLDSLTSILSHPVAWEDIDSYYMLTDKLDRLVPSPKFNVVIATRILIHKLIEELKKSDCTCILTSELIGGSKGFSRDTISEFLADGLIILSYMVVGGEYSRNMVIQKLRSTKHSENIHPVEIREGIGFRVLNP